MFLIKEKPEMDDFEEEKHLVGKEIFKYFHEKNFFNGYPCKNVTKYFCIFFYCRTS